MVSTRNTSVVHAAHGLLSLRNSTVPLTVTRYSLVSTTSPVVRPSQTRSTPSQTRFWTQWTNWYHAFLAEIKDESPSLPIAERRSQATTRWVTFTAKQFHCTESEVRAWLRSADQKALLAA